MPNYNPTQTALFKEKRLHPVGTEEKMGDKIFSTRLPEPIQKKLLSMPRKERIVLIRESIIKAVEEKYQDN